MVHGINNELQTIEPCPWCINLIVMPPNHNKMRPTTHPSHRLLPPPMLLATVIANVVYLYSYYCFFSFECKGGGIASVRVVRCVVVYECGMDVTPPPLQYVQYNAGNLSNSPKWPRMGHNHELKYTTGLLIKKQMRHVHILRM